MRKITIFNFIAGVMLLLCLSMSAFAQEVKPHARITQGGFHPLTCPQGFIQNRDLWQDTISNETWIATSQTKWRLSPTQLGKGIKGDKGDTGANGLNGTNGVDGKDGKDGVDGVCPSCPPSSGGGAFPSIYGKVAFPTNETEYLNAIKLMANGTIRKIVLFGDIWITKDYSLPDTVTNNPTKKLTLDLNNHGLFDGSTNGLKSLFPRCPDDQNEALNVMQSWAIEIYNGYLKGKGSKTLTAIDLGATYNSNVHDLQLDDFKDGIVFRFCLMGKISNIMVNGVTNIAINIDRGNWYGVGYANAQSNSVKAEQIRVFNNTGAYAALQIINASGVRVSEFISEGGSPQYHIIFNSLGSTVVKNGWLMNIHIESAATIAGIKLFLASGYFRAEGNYCQYDNVLYDVESSLGYPHMYVGFVDWFTGGSKLKTKGTSVIWDFDEVAFDPSVSTTWVDGIKPYYWGWEGFNQSPFRKGNNTTTTSAARMTGQDPAEWDVDLVGSTITILKKGQPYQTMTYGNEKQAFAVYSSISTLELDRGKKY